MQSRRPELTEFLRTLHSSINDRAPPGSEAHLLTERIMAALETPRGTAEPAACWQPVCSLIEQVIDNLSAAPGDDDQAEDERVRDNVLEHARALDKLSGHLHWWCRPDAGRLGEPFASGHANATVIGKGGLEERDDVWVGISLMAPNLPYPEHHHPPEEVYLVLSPGHWQQSGGAWHEPGPGGLVHNPPDVMHAMHSGPAPLLATWCLWTDRSSEP